MLKKLLLALVLPLFLFGTANAWYMEISSAADTGSGYYLASVDFNFETGETPGSMNLAQENLALTWGGSTTITWLSVPLYGDAKNPAWEESGFTTGYTTGGLGTIAYGIQQNEPLANQGHMYPVDDDITVYIWFGKTDPGDVQFADYLYAGVQQTKVFLDGSFLRVGEDPGLEITTGGHRLEPTAAIPIPGAIYLLASGLIGLIGLRRRTK